MLSTKAQDLPVKGDTLVIDGARKSILETLDRQNRKGLEKYGTYLMTFNGRDSVRDIWDEVGDEVNYLQALVMEYKRMQEMLFDLYFDVDEARDYMEDKFSEAEVKFIKGN